MKRAHNPGEAALLNDLSQKEIFDDMQIAFEAIIINCGLIWTHIYWYQFEQKCQNIPELIKDYYNNNQQ